MIHERLQQEVLNGEYKREPMIVDIPMAAFEGTVSGSPESGSPPTLSPKADDKGGAPTEATGTTERTGNTGTAQKRICTAVRGDGTRCKSVAARENTTLCARHDRWYRTLPPVLGMPYPEDAVALQDVVAQVLSMVLNREIDVQRGRVAAQLCMVLQRNLKAYRMTVREAEHEAARWVNQHHRVIGPSGDRVI